MNAQTNEQAFEAQVEATLLGSGGWHCVTTAEWDVERALFPAQVCAFLAETQPTLWAQMRALHGAGLEDLLIDALVKELDIKGTLHILRHGFKFYGKTFRLAHFKPAHALNDEVLALYAQNKLTVTRQVSCHPNKRDTVDLLFALNGLPVATCELKNPGTGQSWRQAVQQYQEDRDPRAPLFHFKTRALVHFAADPDEVHMSTRLNGEDTRFLPFNRGSHPGQVQCGAGNPQHASGYRTGYFWQEVLERNSFLDILGHFMFVEKKEEKSEDDQGSARRIVHETMIFPRYHQLDSVRQLVAAARADGAGQNYLVQHSAGSGKTNSISWLSHRLASLHAFKPYYDKTEVIETSDPSRLEALKHALDQAQVYFWSEVEEFTGVFYKAPEDQRASDHADMQKCLQPAVTRFDAIEQDDTREQFRDKLSGYVGLYAYLSQIVPYGDPEQEMLYSYGHFLLPHLPLDRDDAVIKLGSEVALQYYRLERVSSGPINVSEGEPQHVRPPTEVGTGRAQDPKAPLSEIIEVLNERFGTQFNEVDRLFFQQIKEKACNDETVVETARANPRDRFELGIKSRLDELMIERMSEND